jgi:hypothetical protein
MIDLTQATFLARQELNRLSELIGTELALDLEATVETTEGWLFFWNSAAFLINSSLSDALAGNGPLRVHRETGTVERLAA